MPDQGKETRYTTCRHDDCGRTIIAGPPNYKTEWFGTVIWECRGCYELHLTRYTREVFRVRDELED